jgi:hypothetical protein
MMTSRVAACGLLFVIAITAMIAGGFGVVGSVVYGVVGYVADYNISNRGGAADRHEAARPLVEINVREKAK